MSVVSKEVAKLELYLEGLGCSNCARKIEKELNNLSYIEEAELNFVLSRLTIRTYRKENIINDIQSIVDRIENGVIVKNKSDYQNNINNTNNAMECKYNNNEQVNRKRKTYPEEEIEKNELSFTNGNKTESKYKDLIYMFLIKKWRLFWGSSIFIISILLFEFNILAFHFPPSLKVLMYFIAYLIIGGPVVFLSIKNIRRGQIFDENFLMSIATFGAFAINEYPEAVAVMLFYMIGQEFENRAVGESRRSIRALMDIKAEYANLKDGDNIIQLSPETIRIGQDIIVKPGERVPLDGKVIEGEAMLDTSALTGESKPRKVVNGDEVLSGMISKDGLLTIEVEKEFKESTVNRILNLVENASARKAKTEKFISKFASYYTPVVVFLALALATLPPLLISDGNFSEWIYRALIFLVISCPCALVVSIPLGFFGGIGRASREGVLIKGGNYLEALNKIETLVFDKTGTLTKGVFQVDKVLAFNNFREEELLEFAAYAEENSNHPISKSIKEAYSGEVKRDRIKSFQEISGQGLKITLDDKEILLGNKKLMNKYNIDFKTQNEENNRESEIDNKKLSRLSGTIVYLAVDNVLAGYINISDVLKEDTVATIKELKKLGIKNMVMLSGDRKETVEKIADIIGMNDYHAELLPADKVDKVEELLYKSRQGYLAFVGDGINDAPVLARADLGIAMGGLGSDAAIEAADVVLMTDEPSKIVDAIKTARITRKIVWQNIVIAFAVKGLFLILGALGVASLWEAVFADVGVALIAVINAMRIAK
ncbi:heavy metal translocating P-type ATPase [Natronospora cellulosivora (SeqCode)]